MEKILNDLNYCMEYYRTIEEDSKCCGGITYEYITKCCNSAELNNVYEIVMKLFARNYILTVSYDYFTKQFSNVMFKFIQLKSLEEQFIYNTKYFDEDYIKKLRYLHIFDIHCGILCLGDMYTFLPQNVIYNHSIILLDIFYKLYIENFIEENKFLDCFKGTERICHNVNFCLRERHPLKAMYLNLIEANRKKIENIKYTI